MSKKISLFSLIAFILGIIGSLIIPHIFPPIAFIGTIYINLLKIMIVPVLFTGIAIAFSSNSKENQKITLKTIALFVIMFAVSFGITAAVVGISRPGEGAVFAAIAWDGTLADTSLAGFFTSIVPDNIIKAASTNAMLPTILFAAIFGIALGKTSSIKTAEILKELNTSFTKMLGYIMYLTPIGVFALIGNTVVAFGTEILVSSFTYIALAYLCCLAIAILVMIIPVWLIAKINPITYIKNVAPIWVTTLSTCSSAATLPVTIRTCNEKFGIPFNITDIVVPLGCTIHMCGGAVSFCLLAMYNMQVFNIPMTIGLFGTMLVIALLINMGAPGIPGGGIVIGATYLTTLGIPIDFIGIYAGIYRILDMAYTTMNVTGDISANIIINKWTKKS